MTRIVSLLMLALMLMAASPEDIRRDLQEAEEAMTSARELTAQGEARAAKKRLSEAEKIYQRLLTQNPQQRDAAVGLSAVYFLQKRYEDGVTLMQPFHDRLPDDADVTHQLGMHVYRTGQMALAVPLLEAVARDPNRFDAAWMLALHYYRQGDWDKGLVHAEHYHTARPDDVESLALIGTYYLKAQQHERAVEVLDVYLKAHPENVSARINRANALFRKGEVDRAGREYEDLLAKFPDKARFLYNLASVRIKQDRCDDALPLLDKFLKKEPKNGPALYFKADCLAKLERWDEAKDAFAKAGNEGPQNPWVYYGLSRVALKKGDNPGAIENAQKAVDLAEQEPELAGWLGTLLRRVGNKPAEALGWHDRAITLDPNDSARHVERGRDLWALDRLDEAGGAFDKARELDPTTPGALEGAAAARTAYGVKLFGQGKTADAEQQLSGAVKLAESYQPARANLAIVMVAQARAADARKLLDDAPEGARGADLLAASALVALTEGKVDEAAEDAAKARAAGSRMTLLLTEIEGHIAARRDNWEGAAKAFEEAATTAGRPALEKARALAWLELGLQRLGRGEGAARDALSRAQKAKASLDAEDQATLDFALQALGVVTADNGAQAAKNMVAAMNSAKYAGVTWSRVRDVGFGYAAYGYLKSGNAAEARKALEKVRDKNALGQAYDVLLTSADDVEARRLFQAGNFAGAETLWAGMVARGANDPGLRNNLAAARFQQGKTADAEAAWQQLAAAGAPNEALYNLGNALGRKGEHKRSWELLRRYVGTGGSAATLKDRVDTKARLFGFKEGGT